MGLWLVFYKASLVFDWPFLIYARLVLALAVMYLVGSVWSRITSRRLGWPEDRALHVTLSLLYAGLLPPVILVIYNYLTGGISVGSVFLIYALLLLPGLFLSGSGRDDQVELSSRRLINLLHEGNRLIRHPVVWALIIVALVHAITLSSFSFLPAHDNYSILLKAEQNIEAGQIVTTGEIERYPFDALIIIIRYLSGLSLFSIFKYVIPGLTILSVIPLWLLARSVSNKYQQLIILLFPLASPTLILEFDITRYQVVFLAALFSFIGLLYESYISKRLALFYVVGGFSVMGLLFHPLFSLFFLLWIFAWLWSRRNHIIKIKYMLWLLAGLMAAGRFGISDMYKRMEGIARLVISGLVNMNVNFRFPARYINVDGSDVGWPGISGVTKYYAYYAGPFILTILVLVIVLFGASSSARRRFMSAWSNPATGLILLMLAMFMFIADIFPRIISLAYLPDRAWQLIGILMVMPLAFILRSVSGRRSFIITIWLFIALLGSVSGAIYINNLTKFTMPDYELTAAEWIKDNLPEDPIIFSHGSSDLIKYHARATRIKMNLQFYYQASFPEAVTFLMEAVGSNTSNPDLNNIILAGDKRFIKPFESYIQSMVWFRDSYVKTGQMDEAVEIAKETEIALKEAVKEINKQLYEMSIETQVENNDITLSEVYIYFARADPRNPYIDRPYLYKWYQIPEGEEMMVWDRYPDLFPRIYQDGDKVVIWRVDLNKLRDYANNL